MSRRHIASAAIAVAALAGTTVWATQANAGGDKAVARTTLRSAAGDEVGKVWLYRGVAGRTLVRVRFDAVKAGTAIGRFHGFHIHANDSGEQNGCLADPTAAKTTWFTAADGHWKVGDQVHGDHKGDMPSVFAPNANGPMEMWFQTDEFTPAEAVGRAVIVHDGADNFGNVPLTGDTGYTANSTAALTTTANTGNAGARIACGVLEKR